jgi:hypothetical protein
MKKMALQGKKSDDFKGKQRSKKANKTCESWNTLFVWRARSAPRVTPSNYVYSSGCFFGN